MISERDMMHDGESASGGAIAIIMVWKLMQLAAVLCLLFLLTPGLLAQSRMTEAGGAWRGWEELVKPSVVYATITGDTAAYDGWGSPRREVGTFAQGETVEVVRDYNYQWYQVRADDGREGWVPVDKLAIPADPETNVERLPVELVEAFVNMQGFTSKTDQLVWVDIDRQLTYVFVGQAGNWTLVRTMPCATGKNVSPTLRGLHETAERGEWFFAERFGEGAENWVQFSGPYLFHSLPMDRHRTIVDYTLGERRSAGCVRLSMEDSHWFYSFIKRGSTVFVN
ncbi:MAG: L,D-transpeptidase family protein [Firmicutes bacterium]|nr:L,D-transpeptidase family protein [Bacillota bacterium]